ncbi:MAG: hypothetical protein PUH90_00750 [Clostridia bacterium]|nr:hypothetical protein [Clostridia bacterium]MDY2714663.1 hypothetical protein [Christensenellaceae bacterium]MDY3724942.1 hypothetical protein [Christensenellaceae bacterium]
MLFNLLEIDTETVLKSLEILWKGLLAIVIVVGIIMLITYFMQYVSKRIEENKQKKFNENSENNPPDENLN